MLCNNFFSVLESLSGVPLVVEHSCPFRRLHFIAFLPFKAIWLSFYFCRDGFHSIVLSLEKIFKDGRRLVNGGSSAPTAKQLKQRVGVKPSLSDCLEGLRILYEMHHSEYDFPLCFSPWSWTLFWHISVID